MQIELGSALDMHQRRDLVHPAAVIALIVFLFDPVLPTIGEEKRLDLADRLARNHDVDIPGGTPLGNIEAGGRVSCALERDEAMRGAKNAV